MNAPEILDLSVSVLGTGFIGQRYLDSLQGKVRRLIICSNDEIPARCLPEDSLATLVVNECEAASAATRSLVFIPH